MTLINVGELIKRLDDEIRNSNDHVQWRDYAGFRDVAAHAYFSIRMDRVWVYAKEELPIFASQIQTILNSDNKTE